MPVGWKIMWGSGGRKIKKGLGFRTDAESGGEAKTLVKRTKYAARTN